MANCHQNELVEAITIEDVQHGLESFQERLLRHGKDIFGDEFAAISIEGQEEVEDEQPSAVPCHGSLSQGRQPLKSAKAKLVHDGAKNVLSRFLDDREKLLKMEIIQSAAHEKLKHKLEMLEKKSSRLSDVLKEIEKRRRNDTMSKEAFLTELRKKLAYIERRQSRLLAMSSMPDSDERDVVLERHKKLEEREVRSTWRTMANSAEKHEYIPTHTEKVDSRIETIASDDSTSFHVSLGELTKELQQIEMCMDSL